MPSNGGYSSAPNSNPHSPPESTAPFRRKWAHYQPDSDATLTVNTNPRHFNAAVRSTFGAVGAPLPPALSAPGGPARALPSLAFASALTAHLSGDYQNNIAKGQAKAKAS